MVQFRYSLYYIVNQMGVGDDMMLVLLVVVGTYRVLFFILKSW